MESSTGELTMEASMLFLIFSFFLSSLPLSRSQPDKEYWKCQPSPCGKLRNIDYPFWSDKSYCGSAGFYLDCPQDEYNYPLIQIESQTFNVTQINQFTYRMTLVRTDFVYDNCSSHLTNTSVSSRLSPFHYDEPYENVSLFYDCPHDHSTGGIEFACHPPTTSNSNSYNYAFYTEDVKMDPRFPDLIKNCKHHVQVPVSVETDGHPQDDPQALLRKALGEGFRVQYNVDESCEKCLHSYGRCGSNNRGQFACYCRDGHHPLNCPDSFITSSSHFL